jgi:hypothetical protein
VARYQTDSESWSGNGAYLGLVLTVANGMPLLVDLLEAILRMPAEDREKVFGDRDMVNSYRLKTCVAWYRTPSLQRTNLVNVADTIVMLER